MKTREQCGVQGLIERLYRLMRNTGCTKELHNTTCTNDRVHDFVLYYMQYKTKVHAVVSYYS